MASISGQVRNACNLLCRTVQSAQAVHHLRPLSTTSSLLKKDKPDEEQDDNEKSKKAGWFKRSLMGQGHSHSSHLSSKEDVYEMMFHKVKPEYMEEYLKEFGYYQEMMHEKSTGAVLKGSFTVEIGEQDTAIHLWQYKGGYTVLNNATDIYRTDKDFINYRKARNTMLNGRANQILLKFDFWPEIEAREGPNLYELRTYTLKAGSNYEWKLNWEKGLKFREECKPTAGFISQIGEQYQVHHIWSETYMTCVNFFSSPGTKCQVRLQGSPNKDGDQANVMDNARMGRLRIQNSTFDTRAENVHPDSHTLVSSTVESILVDFLESST